MQVSWNSKCCNTDGMPMRQVQHSLVPQQRIPTLGNDLITHNSIFSSAIAASSLTNTITPLIPGRPAGKAI